MSLLAHAPYKIPVIVTNESEQDTYIPPLSVIAELETYKCILSQHHVTDLSAKKTSSNLNLNFGNSPITPEGKE